MQIRATAKIDVHAASRNTVFMPRSFNCFMISLLKGPGLRKANPVHPSLYWASLDHSVVSPVKMLLTWS